MDSLSAAVKGNYRLLRRPASKLVIRQAGNTDEMMIASLIASRVPGVRMV